MQRRALRRIALLIETSTSWGSQIIEGVNDYVHDHQPWILSLDHRGVYETPRLPFDWQGDGIIARVISPALVEQITRTAVPAVNVSQIQVPNSPLPQVTADEHAIGQLTAEHLLDRGLKSFGYVGPPYRAHYTDRVVKAFADTLARAGREFSYFDPDRHVRTGDTSHDSLPQLIRWIQALPRPLGIVAWNTAGARRVTNACAELELHIPDDVAVLSADQDELMARIANPPLSCVDHAPRRVGYEAAALLHRLMDGQAPPPAPLLVAPLGVVARQSTDTLSVDDADVASAIRFIRENAHRPIRVGDVVRAVPLSRRALELRFRRVLGRSPAAEIRRARIDRARRLLVETQLSVGQIATRCGFNHTEVLQRVFRSELKLSPSQYRSRYQQQRQDASPRRATIRVSGSDLRV